MAHSVLWHKDIVIKQCHKPIIKNHLESSAIPPPSLRESLRALRALRVSIQPIPPLSNNATNKPSNIAVNPPPSLLLHSANPSALSAPSAFRSSPFPRYRTMQLTNHQKFAVNPPPSSLLPSANPSAPSALSAFRSKSHPPVVHDLNTAQRHDPPMRRRSP